MGDPVTLAFFGDSDSLLVQMLLPAGLALITIALFARLRKRRQAGGDGAITAREQLERYRQEKGVRGDMETLMVEIEQLAKRMSAQLDAKSIELDRLIREADVRLMELRQREGQGMSPPLPPTPPGPGASRSGGESGADSPDSADADPLSRRVCELADQGLGTVDIARQLDEHVGKVELILALRKSH